MPLYLPDATPARIFSYAATWIATAGAPTLTFDATIDVPLWRLDQTTAEEVTGGFTMPPNWSTFDMFVWTCTIDATASNVVRFSNQVKYAASGDSALTTLGPGATNTSIAGGAASNIARHAHGTGFAAPTAGQPCWTRVFRDAGNAADNFAGDIGVLALELVRAS